MQKLTDLNFVVTTGQHVLSRRIGDEVILLDTTAELYLSLNPTAAMIWDCLCAGLTPEATIDAVTKEFDVDQQTSKVDFLTIVEELEKASIVSVTRPAEA